MDHQFAAYIPGRATIQPVSATRKPVIVRQWTRDWHSGYAASSPANEESEMEMLDTAGKLLRLEWKRIKWICYVRELGREALGSAEEGPERLLRRRFAARPRIAGVWLRLSLLDGEELEGVAANDRSLIEGAEPGAGLMLTPPDTRSNTQRVFVPRIAIREFTILGVIPPKTSERPGQEAQPLLFDQETEN